MENLVAKYKRGNVVMHDGEKTKIVDYEFNRDIDQFTYLLENGVTAAEMELSKPAGAKTGTSPKKDKTTPKETKPKKEVFPKFEVNDYVSTVFLPQESMFVGTVKKVRKDDTVPFYDNEKKKWSKKKGTGFSYYVEQPDGNSVWILQRNLKATVKGNKRGLTPLQKRMKAFLALDGKAKTKEELIAFHKSILNDLEKGIINKKVDGAREEYLVYIQKWLSGKYAKMLANESVTISLQGEMVNKMRKMLDKIMPFKCVEYGKKIIKLVGRSDADSREAAGELVKEIASKQHILKNEAAWDKFEPLLKRLRIFANGGTIMSIPQMAMSGFYTLKGAEGNEMEGTTPKKKTLPVQGF